MPGRSVTQRASCRALRCSWMPGHHTLRTLRFDILPRPKTSGDDTLSNDGNARPLLRQVADRLARGARQREVLDEHVALADLERLGLEVLVHAPLVERVGVEQPGLRIERGVRPVLAAPRRRPVLGGL